MRTVVKTAAVISAASIRSLEDAIETWMDAHPEHDGKYQAKLENYCIDNPLCVLDAMAKVLNRTSIYEYAEELMSEEEISSNYHNRPLTAWNFRFDPDVIKKHLGSSISFEYEDGHNQFLKIISDKKIDSLISHLSGAKAKLMFGVVAEIDRSMQNRISQYDILYKIYKKAPTKDELAQIVDFYKED